MKKYLSILVVAFLLAAMLPVAVFAEKGPVQYTVDVRNRTGAPVEFNYRGADGILRWITVPEGVSNLTLDQGVYEYWADPKCGHIAGTLNFSQQRQILWIDCDNAVPSTRLVIIDNRSGGGDGGGGSLCFDTLYESNEEGGYLAFSVLVQCFVDISVYDELFQFHFADSFNFTPNIVPYTYEDFITYCADADAFDDDLTVLLGYSDLPAMPICYWLYD